MKDYSFDHLKGGVREYINILIAIIDNYLLNNNNDELISYLNTLNDLYDSIDFINDIDKLKNVKNIVLSIQTDLDKIITNREKDIVLISKELNTREESLVARGYDKDEVLKLSSYSVDDLVTISNRIIDRITKDCKSVDNPTCIFIGGQPGCGKSTSSKMLKKDLFLDNGIVEIGIDIYRSYHPNYLMIEDCIKKHWINRERTENDSSGNDIADFTHQFAADVTDILADKLSSLKYNLIIEWGMRTPDEPLNTMNTLKKKGYKNIVNFVAVHKDISYNACILRADIMDGEEHIVRRIPKSFHDMCINSLPNSCNKIYNDGYLNNKIIDTFTITTREGNTIWDITNSNEPGEIYKTYLNN